MPHIHVVKTTSEKLERDLADETFASTQVFWVGARDWVVLVEHEDHIPALGETDGGVVSSERVERLLEAIRLTQEYAQLPAVEGWSWYDAYRELRPDDARRLQREWEATDGARQVVPGRQAPTWFTYLWGALSERQIINLELLQALSPPRWVIDFLEAPVTGEPIYEIDTRVETLQRIYEITQGGPADGTSRADWALESLGQIRGLAQSQL